MRSRTLFGSIALLLIAVPPQAPRERAANTPNADAFARGKYLVQDVALCWSCHSPDDARPDPDSPHWLLGGVPPVVPAKPAGEWAHVAPRLAGLPPGTDQQFITLLTTGIARTGRPPRPPMPPFRMSEQDAQAVLAYLKSVKSSE
jgi:mono/diheme cytochrome c family protein